MRIKIKGIVDQERFYRTLERVSEMEVCLIFFYLRGFQFMLEA